MALLASAAHAAFCCRCLPIMSYKAVTLALHLETETGLQRLLLLLMTWLLWLLLVLLLLTCTCCMAEEVISALQYSHCLFHV